MTLSNWISCSRILLSACLLAALHLRTLAGVFGAALIFTLASLTDYWDGWVARQRGEQSTLGAFLDPLADKCLTLAAYWSFVWLHLVPLWMVAVITARELLVTVARMAALPGRSVAALWSGKQKTVAQIIAISAVLLLLIADQVAAALHVSVQVLQAPLVTGGMWLLMAWAMAITVLSGLHMAMDLGRGSVDQSCAPAALTHPSVFVATVGGIGFMPWAPGLAGSLVGLGAAWVLRDDMWLAACTIIVGCGVAAWAIPGAETRLARQDASPIVIDETLGMLLAMWMVPWHWPSVIAGFVVFRLLDVFKPFGIRRLEEQPTPWGVLVDDLACGLIVNAGLQLAVRGFVR